MEAVVPEAAASYKAYGSIIYQDTQVYLRPLR